LTNNTDDAGNSGLAQSTAIAVPSLGFWAKVLLLLTLGGMAWFKLPKTRAGRQAS